MKRNETKKKRNKRDTKQNKNETTYYKKSTKKRLFYNYIMIPIYLRLDYSNKNKEKHSKGNRWEMWCRFCEGIKQHIVSSLFPLIYIVHTYFTGGKWWWFLAHCPLFYDILHCHMCDLRYLNNVFSKHRYSHFMNDYTG